MARRAVLGGGSSLSPFGSGGVDFGAFNIGGDSSSTVDPSQQAYLELQKVETDYAAGRVSDAAYQAALAAYAATLDQGTGTYWNAIQRVADTQYRLARDQLLTAVETGQASWEDLLTFDQQSMAGLDPGSAEYRDRQSLYFQTQSKVFGEYEDDQIALWKSGKLTSAQLQEWYRNASNNPLFGGNYELTAVINANIDNLTQQIQQDADSAFLKNWQAGKVTLAQFTAYASGALSRYTEGTEQYNYWKEQLTTGKLQAQESNLNYRYGLFTRMQDLRKFIADNSTAPKGGTKQRQVWNGSDWVWVTEGTAPSKSAIQAWQARQAEVTMAKQELAQLEATSKAVGGTVSAQTMVNFYTRQQAGLAVGSPEWYAIQSKLDGYVAAAAYEKAIKGVKVSVGTTSGGTTKATGGTATVKKPAVSGGGTGSNISLDAFMRALASVESGGRYDALNKATGAYGKYQFLPSSWEAYSRKYFGSVLPQTPANQEKVARKVMEVTFAKYGDWEHVAQLWNPKGGQSYINKVMGKLGTSPSTPPTVTAAGPLRVITGGSFAPKAQVVTDATGKKVALPSYTVKGATIPSGMDAQAFNGFYQGFIDAFQNGDTQFSVVQGGKTITYYLPVDTEALHDMVRYVDDIHINQVAAVWAKSHQNAPSGPAANSDYGKAIAAAANHEYRMLTVEPGKQSHVPITSPLAVENPIGIAQKLVDDTKAYVEQQRKLAAEQLARGNVTGAWAYSQNATQRVAHLEETLSGEWLPLIDATMAAILKGSAAAGVATTAPAAVTKAYADLLNWEDQLSEPLTKLDQDVTKVLVGVPGTSTRGILKVDKNGYPVWSVSPTNIGAAGTVQLADDTIAVVDKTGKVTYKVIEAGGYTDMTGSFRSKEPGMVPIRVLVDGFVLDAYSKYDVDVVGFTADGKPLMGRIVTLSLDGQTFRAVENPLQPGKWTVNQPIILATPAGMSMKASSVEGGTMYTWKGQDPNGRNMTFALNWDGTKGVEHYVIVSVDPVTGKTGEVWDPADADVQTWLAASGFRPDLSKMKPGSSTLLVNADVPLLGFNDKALQTYVEANRRQVTATTNYHVPYEEARNEARIASGQAPGLYPTSGNVNALNADRWWEDQSVRIAAAPVVRQTGGTVVRTQTQGGLTYTQQMPSNVYYTPVSEAQAEVQAVKTGTGLPIKTQSGGATLPSIKPPANAATTGYYVPMSEAQAEANATKPKAPVKTSGTPKTTSTTPKTTTKTSTTATKTSPGRS